MTLRAAAAAVCTPPLSIRQRAMSDLSRHPSGLAVYSAEGRGTGLDLPPSRDPLYQAVSASPCVSAPAAARADLFFDRPRHHLCSRQ